MNSTLDVGCGVHPRGDVNVDLHTEPTGHRYAPTRINAKKTRNFIKAGALHLPFRDNSFDEARASHVIEHVDNPVKLVKELVRVAKKRVVIEAPHRWRRRGFALRQPRCHKHYFRAGWFHKSLKNFNCEVELTYRPLPRRVFPVFNWPDEIKVTIHLT